MHIWNTLIDDDLGTIVYITDSESGEIVSTGADPYPRVPLTRFENREGA